MWNWFTSRRHRQFCDSAKSQSGLPAVVALGFDFIVDRQFDDDVRRGMAAGEFEIFYQPKLNLRQCTVNSMEGLLRWNHAKRGRLYPDLFIPMVEATGIIKPLTRYVVDRAIRDYDRLRTLGHALPIYINLSASLLTDDVLIDQIGDIIAQSGAEIGLEITERSVIVDPEAAFANLARIRAQGVPVAIDDYGSGLSSLSYLKQLDAIELKIDKSFVIDLTSSHRDPLIVRSTIDLGHALGMVVTAEGVETPAALALLQSMGCDMAQGYQIARPMVFDKLVPYFEKMAETPIQIMSGIGVLTDPRFWQRA